MGALFSRRFDPIRDIPDLSGTVYIVTGGNTGIGYATVKHLARRGAKVYLGARNESKAYDAISKLHKEGLAPGHGEVLFLKIDLSDPVKAREAAQKFLSLENRLDVLVNNAGQIFGEYRQTLYGVSDMMMVNHISPFVFTESLIPLLSRTAALTNTDVRIVNLASDSHRFVPAEHEYLTLDDFNKEFKHAWTPSIMRYSVTKLANILYTSELQRRFNSSNIPIIALAINPGNVNTFSDQLWFPRLSRCLMGIFFQHPDAGSHNSVFAAASRVVRERAQKYQGAYLEPVGKIGKASSMAKNAVLAKHLIGTTTQFLKDVVGLDHDFFGLQKDTEAI